MDDDGLTTLIVCLVVVFKIVFWSLFIYFRFCRLNDCRQEAEHQNHRNVTHNSAINPNGVWQTSGMQPGVTYTSPPPYCPSYLPKAEDAEMGQAHAADDQNRFVKTSDPQPGVTQPPPQPQNGGYLPDKHLLKQPRNGRALVKGPKSAGLKSKNRDFYL